MGQTFRTKNGYCHITEDSLILTQGHDIDSIAKPKMVNQKAALIAFYIMLSAVLITTSYDKFASESYFMALLFGASAVWLIVLVIKSIQYSGVPVIPRKYIQKVLFVEGTTGLTRSRFVVEFLENNSLRKRLILLPATLSGGDDAVKKAIQVMKNQNLLVDYKPLKKSK